MATHGLVRATPADVEHPPDIEDLSAEEVLAYAVERFHPALKVATSFQKEATVILDLVMPDMNGIEVLERLKSDERWRQIPVVMISGLSETDAVIRCIEAAARSGGPAPVAVLRIRLDDGRDFQLDRSVLVGRNPVGQAGEQHAPLLAVDDPGRSISKTQLHLLTDGAGIWVTDRNSTNGSAVTTPDGARTPLAPGVPTFVTPGSSVHFGDRTFYLGQA